MLYDIDSFGFVLGFVSNGIKLMSEGDLKADRRLKREFEGPRYQVWKRHNAIELVKKYDMTFINKVSFDEFCRSIYIKISQNEESLHLILDFDLKSKIDLFM